MTQSEKVGAKDFAARLRKARIIQIPGGEWFDIEQVESVIKDLEASQEQGQDALRKRIAAYFSKEIKAVENPYRGLETDPTKEEEGEIMLRVGELERHRDSILSLFDSAKLSEDSTPTETADSKPIRREET